MLSYDQVTFEMLRDDAISVERQPFVPSGLPAPPLPEWLSAYLHVATASATVSKSEKSVSEALIAPVLYAVRQANADKSRFSPVSRSTPATWAAAATLSSRPVPTPTSPTRPS